jgi:L-threonylcarbamoyladenylate synthase
VRRIGLDDLLASPEESAALAATLAGGGVAAIPTETFYGLAADPHSRAGAERILDLKRRDETKALLVLFSRRAHLDALGVTAAPATLARFFGLWPAPLTVVLNLRAPIPASLGLGTLAVRLPAHAALRRLLERIGPVTATSANRAGAEPCVDPDEVARLFAGELDTLVDGGRTPGGLASTLVDATIDPPRRLRAGAFPWPSGSP